MAFLHTICFLVACPTGLMVVLGAGHRNPGLCLVAAVSAALSFLTYVPVSIN
jgi:hypothetical protein